MKRTFRPAVFLGTVIVLCSAWLWARPAPTVDTFARSAPRRVASVDPVGITLDSAALERYAGRYEGRGDFAVELTLKNGKLFAPNPPGTVAYELVPLSETEFFVKGLRYNVEFDVADDGTVRGFATNTEFGLIEVTRVR